MMKMTKLLGIALIIVGLFTSIGFAATITIPTLPDGSNFVSGSNQVAADQSGTTRRILVSDIRAKAVWAKDYGTFALANAAATAAADTDLVVDEAITLTQSETIAAGNRLVILGEGTITKASTYTITFASGSDFIAPYKKVFIGFSAGDITGLISASPVHWGCVQDSTTECGASILAAARAATRIEFPDNGSGSYYKSTTAIALINNGTTNDSNKRFVGIGGKPQIYNDAVSSSAALFTITGDASNKVKNIIFDSLNLRNGTSSSTTYTSGRDGITAEYAEDITIYNVEMPHIQGAYSIKHKYTDGFYVMHSKFTTWTYAAIASLIESEKTLIYRNFFGTPMTTAIPGTYAQHYGIMTGSETTGAGTFAVLDYRAIENEFSFDATISTSYWCAMNTHGGANIRYSGNRVTGYRLGLIASLDDTFLASGSLLKNVWITDNYMDRSGATAEIYENANASGILVQGTDWTRDGNFTISGNYLKGYGGYAASPHTAVPASAAIMFGKGFNFKVYQNRIENYQYAAIYPTTAVDGADIIGNDIKNVDATYYQDAIDHSWSSFGIAAPYAGLYRINIDENKVYATARTGVVQNAVYFSQLGNIIIGEKNQLHSSTAQITNGNWGYTAIPTTKYWKHGDPVWAAWGTANKLYMTEATHPVGSYLDGHGMFGWFGTALTVNATASAYTATIASSPTTNYVYVPRGAWVTITGAGSGGSNLTTQVLSTSTAGVLTLADAIVTSVTGANIVMVTPTWRGVGGFAGSATWDPGNLADGAGETSSGITVTGAALGDYCMVSAPYDLQDMTATCYVQAANTVEIRLQNESGGTIDLASGTWRVRTMKY